MKHAAAFTRDGAAPMDIMDAITRHEGRYIQLSCSKCSTDERLKKWLMTKSADTVMDMSVAIAAPFMPQPSQKMNIGASMTLTPAPMNIVTIALTG